MDKGSSVCQQTQKCKQENRSVRWVCLHPICNNFMEMCEVCHLEHIQFHSKNKLSFEGEYANSQVTIEALKETAEKILGKVMGELTVIQEKIMAEIRSLSGKENPTDSVIAELQLIRKQVNELFDEMIERLRDDSERAISQKMKTLYEEITYKIQETANYTKMMGTKDFIRSVRDVTVYDFLYQTQIQRQRMEQVLDECTIKNNSEKVVDDDIALKLISSVKKDLDNILQRAGPKRDDRVNLKKAAETRQATKNWLFYFEPYTKNFHYVDINDSSPVFQTIQLQIDFQIQPGNRSILARDNCIYLVGGYDASVVNPENEEQFKCVYKLDIERHSLQKVSTLITLRHSFGLCQLQNYLYVIGGYNYTEGSLAKCERIPLEKEGYLNPVPINNLQKRASHLTVCSWQNKIIVKYGGILLDQNTPGYSGKQGYQIVVSEYQTEFYVPANDQWVQIQTLNYPCTFLSGSIEIKSDIVIFGGIAVTANDPSTVNNNNNNNNSSAEKEIISITNNLIRLKSYKISTLDIEISKSSNLQENSYCYSQPIFKDSSNPKKKQVFFLGFNNIEYKNPTLKPQLKQFEIYL